LCLAVFKEPFHFIALSDNHVWAEGLLVFYEIFHYLEEAMVRLKDTPVGKLYIEGIQRTDAFEKDLSFYLGPDWMKNYKPRNSVREYLFHLKKLESSDPNQLIAYIYHLYMGLLSGGQILRKKRAVVRKFIPLASGQTYQDAVTDFGAISISKLKRDLVESVNRIAEVLDDEAKQKLIKESKTVFLMNNNVIRSVEGASEVILKKLITIIIILLLSVIFCYIIF
jgi:heme oxygenase